jgi:D-alanyl-D-alanine carboxypeptidase/D-alanyl-D-alanine-endopeptidase (penicillin-binding protein 4)
MNFFSHAMIGIYAVYTDTGEVLIDQNSNASLTPASCMKIITTGAALHILGPDTRFETYLEYDGIIDKNEVLHGNVYIRGGGDPCLGSDRIVGSASWQKQIEIWVEAIRKAGIKQIEGKVIGDASRWEKAMAVPSWLWEDLGNYFGAGACALSFHENYYSLTLKPGEKVGDHTTILSFDPPQKNLSFYNETTTGPQESGDLSCIYGSEFSPIQYIRGTIPAGVNEFVVKGAIPDPATFCSEMLTEKLQSSGINIGGKMSPQHTQRIIIQTTQSPTVKEIVHWINKESINLYAEHLLKKMGEVVFNDGSTSSGLKAVTNFWKSQGIDLTGFHMADGSGLSRKNLVTTKQFVEILLKMEKTTFYQTFLDSLPQLEGSMRAKSGSMSFVKGYTGYAGNIAFAAIVNQGTDADKLKEKIQSILLEINDLNTAATTL